MGAVKLRSDVMVADRTHPEHAFREARAAFEEIEMRLGELAAYLSDIADGLTDNPEELDRSLTKDWPDLGALVSLRRTWIERRNAMIAAWRKLEPSRRASQPLPVPGGLDRSRAVV